MNKGLFTVINIRKRVYELGNVWSNDVILREVFWSWLKLESKEQDEGTPEKKKAYGLAEAKFFFKKTASDSPSRKKKACMKNTTMQ